MTPLELFLSILLIGLSLIFTILSMKAWKRKGGRTMGYVLLAFLLFLSMSVLSLSADLLGWEQWRMSNELMVVNIAILSSFYLALVRG